MTKIWVAPESAIASFDAIVIAVYSPVAVVNEEKTDSRLVVEPSETFDVTSVMSSSSTIISLTGGGET